MNRESIINYLKFNKKQGITFNFMPKEVQKWCYKHMDSLLYYHGNEGWTSNAAECLAVALPDDFIDPQNHWVEFEIDKDGCFQPFTDTHYKWFDWCSFLRTHPEYDSFGGWLFDCEPNEIWCMTPIIADKYKNLKTTICGNYTDKESDDRPLIPIKIRFWKGE